jgi:hypothetical protein
MLTRNDQPIGFGFNFANDVDVNFAINSVFTVFSDQGNFVPPPSDSFLLLDGTNFLLLDNEFLLLL